MLSELEQLLACRRERENRSAAALRQIRLRQSQAEADVVAAQKALEDHHRERRERQDKLYRRSQRSLLTKQAIDDLNIELDLMAEETDLLVKKVQEAEAVHVDLTKEVDKAAAIYRQHRQAGDRWGALVTDVTETERRRVEQVEEFTIEDDLGDRRASGMNGF
ncbi:MAG: YscO family type III secretion system apparatus protein [Pseudomonadota bacterium]